MKKWLTALLVLIPSICLAASVSLQWDPNTEPDLAGYKVYYSEGTLSPAGATIIDVRNQTTATIPNLDLTKKYSFAVTAYNTSGLESGYSNIVTVYDLPAPSTFKLQGITFPRTGVAAVTLNWPICPAGVKSTIVRFGLYSGNKSKMAFTGMTSLPCMFTSTTIEVSDIQKWFFRAASTDGVVESLYMSNYVGVAFIKTPKNLKFQKIEVR